MEAGWGTGVGISAFAPSRAADPAARQFWARLQATSASPSAAATFLHALTEIDIRDSLPAIGAPTLILHAERDHHHTHSRRHGSARSSYPMHDLSSSTATYT